MTENIDKKTQGEMAPPFPGQIRGVTIGDLESLRTMLAEWIRTDDGQVIPEEIEEIINSVCSSISEHEERFLVVEGQEGKAEGMIGYKVPDATFAGFAQTAKPAELINLYLSDSLRGQGLGRKLVQDLETSLRENGFEEIIVGSGPRYEKTGWGFYDSLEGYSRTGVAKDYYAPGRDAQIWTKLIKGN